MTIIVLSFAVGWLVHATRRAGVSRSFWRRPLSPIAWALLAGLVLRLVIFIAAWAPARNSEVFHVMDTHTYMMPARELATTGSFAINGAPEFRRTPGYPLLLIPGILLGQVEFVTIGLQIAFGVATIYLIYRATLLTTGSAPLALAAAWCYACEPIAALYCSIMLSETLFTFLIVLAWHECARYFQNQSGWILGSSALALAAAALVRPLGYYLPPVIALTLVARAIGQREGRRRGLIHATAFLLIGVAPLAGWQARNATLAGYPGFSGISDYNLYFFQEASILSRQTGKSFYDVQYELGMQDNEKLFARHPDWRGLDMAQLLQLMGAEGKQTVRDNRWEYAKIHLTGLVTLVLDPGTTDYLTLVAGYVPTPGRQSRVEAGPWGLIVRVFNADRVVLGVSLALGAVLAAYWGLCCFGLWVRARSITWSEVVLLVMAGYFFALCGGPTALARMRHPMGPAMAILAGYGLIAIVARIASRRRGAKIEPTRALTSPDYSARLAA